MIIETISDTGFVLSLRWILAAVFLTGLLHKLKSPGAFVTILNGYRLLPEALTAPAAYLVLAAEVVAAAALIANARLGSVVALCLLCLYTLAIAINLVRGRRDIDCGCAGPAVRQTLSGWLVVRNIGLIIFAVMTFLPEVVRELVVLDWFTALAAAVTFSLLYSAAAQVFAVRGRVAH